MTVSAALLIALAPALKTGTTPGGLQASQAPAQSQAWSISPSGALEWQGTPYLPLGVRIRGDAEEVRAASRAGIKDVAVEVSSNGEGWAPLLAALKEEQMRYFLVLSSPAPPLASWRVEPSGFRRAPVTEPHRFTWPFPKTPELLALTVSRRDGTILRSDRASAKDGIITVQVEPRGLDAALLLYPHSEAGPYPDYWDGWDAHRDGLLRALKQNSLGTGLRGIINPAGRAESFPEDEPVAVPSSRLFQIELEQLLEARYRRIGDALQAWGLRATEIKSFADMSKLVPLWGGGRGIGSFYIPEQDRMVTADPGRSAAWRDIRDVMREAMHRRTNRLVASIQSIVHVPVLQDFTGWAGPQERSATALAGLGAVGSAYTLNEASAAVSRPAGQVASWIRPGLIVASKLEATPQGRAPQDVVLQTLALGARGWFFSGTPEIYPLVAKAIESRAAESGATFPRPRFVYYPEAAEGSAETKPLSGGVVWAPTSFSGERLYLGRLIEGYRSTGPGEPFMAIWSKSGEPVRVRFRIASPGEVKVESTDGADPRVIIRGRNLLELTLGSSPVLLSNLQDVPASIEAFNEMAGHLTSLFRTYESRMEDGGQMKNDLGEAIRMFDELPGASFTKLAGVYAKGTARAGAYLWIEAETLREHTFPDIEVLSGAAGGRVLAIPARLGAVAATAKFQVNARRNSVHEVWVAARLPLSKGASLTLSIGGSEFKATGDQNPVYAGGLAWQKLGEIELDAQTRMATLRAEAPLGTTLLLDAILITPDAFSPNGPFPPTSWIDALPKGPSQPGLPGRD